MTKKEKTNQEVLLSVYDDYFCQLTKKDLSQVAKNSGSVLKNGFIEVDFYNQKHMVDIGQKIIKKQDGKAADPYTSSIILHYLVQAKGTPQSGKWIPYRELPDGLFYAQTIEGVLAPLVQTYGSNLEAFYSQAEKLGARKSKEFDCGVVIYSFKKVPLLVIMYPADEEFGAEANILFDSTISDYLKTDIVKLITVYTVKLFLKE